MVGAEQRRGRLRRTTERSGWPPSLRGRRIVLEAVLDTGVCFVAESQAGGPPWRLEQQWGPTEWGRSRLPRTAERVEKLTDDVIAWLMNTGDPGSITGPA